MRDYFELLWEKATPFGSTRAQQASGVTPVERVILELLNQGMQDATIARQIGTSQSTVRRHITAMTNRLKVNSRFAFGAAAQRRGWLD
jgi:DNA-binding NarL/FixJ family response regulator